MENGVISVDKWTGGSQAYFLTHLHSDHTQGLSSSWSRGPLFCSKVTATLFPFKFPHFDLSLLRVLHLGAWHTLSLVSPSSASRLLVNVIAIDAHHCPGAVMYLFQGEFGFVLYTGDFRWEAKSERAKKGRDMLRNALQGHTLAVLYLDNTYCNPSFHFPSRILAAQKIVDIIESHPEHDIVIGIDTLGKEELLVHISRMLKIKVWVWPERLQTMHLLGFHEMFTTKTSLTRVRAIPRYSFSVETLEELNKVRPTIGIMPSGLPWVVKTCKGDDSLSGSLITRLYQKRKASSDRGAQAEQHDQNISVDKFHRFMYSVAYSDHSCFSEIKEFVELVRPSSIKGIVSSSSCYVDPLYYFGRLCGANQPSDRSWHKFKCEDKGRRHVSVEMKRYLCGGTINETEQKKRKIGHSSVRVSRVSSIRRLRRGAKLCELIVQDLQID